MDSDEQVMIDISRNHATRSGLYFRNVDFRRTVQRLKDDGYEVVGIVFDGSNSLEFIVDPPIGDGEE